MNKKKNLVYDAIDDLDVISDFTILLNSRIVSGTDYHFSFIQSLIAPYFTPEQKDRYEQLTTDKEKHRAQYKATDEQETKQHLDIELNAMIQEQIDILDAVIASYISDPNNTYKDVLDNALETIESQSDSVAEYIKNYERGLEKKLDLTKLDGLYFLHLISMVQTHFLILERIASIHPEQDDITRLAKSEILTSAKRLTSRRIKEYDASISYRNNKTDSFLIGASIVDHAMTKLIIGQKNDIVLNPGSKPSKTYKTYITLETDENDLIGQNLTVWQKIVLATADTIYKRDKDLRPDHYALVTPNQFIAVMKGKDAPIDEISENNESKSNKLTVSQSLNKEILATIDKLSSIRLHQTIDEQFFTSRDIQIDPNEKFIVHDYLLNTRIVENYKINGQIVKSAIMIRSMSAISEFREKSNQIERINPGYLNAQSHLDKTGIMLVFYILERILRMRRKIISIDETSDKKSSKKKLNKNFFAISMDKIFEMLSAEDPSYKDPSKWQKQRIRARIKQCLDYYSKYEDENETIEHHTDIEPLMHHWEWITSNKEITSIYITICADQDEYIAHKPDLIIG